MRKRATGEWAGAVEDYFAEHDDIGAGPDARGPQLFLVEEQPASWEVQQVLADPEGHHDWRITATVDLEATDEEGELVLDVTGLHRLD